MSKVNWDSIIQKARWFMLVLFSAILFCVVIALGLLWSYSPGKPKPFLDANGKPLSGSISEKSFVEINHSHQGMFIKGKEVTKPVKGFYTFGKSAHSPMFEESEKVQRILRVDVLAGLSNLADAD